ncbi:MAG: hypothetical protein NWE89_00860 [Candidatus Bathyarchaeota archaeon]|nr:hypothetical protein [Candidatus Bathyarchaeota archaeon]
MTEEDNRTAYNSERILIESARIIDPQFNDGILHITGAQIELLRNVAKYLDRRTTFVAAYEQQYYLTPDIHDWDGITAIVADLQEVLMGNNNVIFGYYAQLLEDISGDVAGTGTFVASTGTPPTGEIWVIQVVSILDRFNNPTLVRMMLDDDGSFYVLNQSASPGSGTPVVYSGSFEIQNLQRIRVDVQGSTPEDPIAALVLGYKMQVFT